MGEKLCIELQGVSRSEPKPSRPNFPIIIAEGDRNAREVIRAALDQYNGRQTVNIRTWYRDGDTLKPGKSALTLAVNTYRCSVWAPEKALEAARELRFLDDGASDERGP